MDEETRQRLLSEDTFGLLVPEAKPHRITSDDRALAGFQEIVDFYAKYERVPDGDSADMAEARLGWRLDGIRSNDDLVAILRDADIYGLLTEPKAPESIADVLADDPFGLLSSDTESIFELKHVAPPVKEKPNDVAQREPAENFEKFEPLFVQCHTDLKAGQRKLITFQKPSNIQVDRFFVLNGQLGYVASIGDTYRRDKQRQINARLLCIFENGTQSNLLLQSLARQLYDGGKLVTESVSSAPAMELEANTEYGHLYVLESLSADPQVRAVPHLHKIGFTRGVTAERIRGAESSDTYLRAPVKVVLDYKVPVAIAGKLEHLLHRAFADVRLDVAYKLSGYDIATNQEWFSVPRAAIEEAVGLFESGAIVNYTYDQTTKRFVLR